MKKFWYIILFLFLGVLTFSSLLRSGYFPMHDDMQAMRVLQMTKCFEDGQIPCRWVPDMGYGYGYPQFNFYPPIPYYLMTFIHMAGASVLGSVKTGFVLTFFVAGIGMFLLGRKFWNVNGGILSSLFYLYLPYRAVNVYVRGAMGEIWALAWFPWILWSLEEYFESKKTKYLIFLSLSLFGLTTSHLLSVIMIAPFLIVWTGWKLWKERKNFKLLIRGLIGSGLLTFGLSAFYVLPTVFEKKYAHFETLLMGYFNYLAHFVSLKQMFLLTYWDYGSSIHGINDEMSFQIGLLHWMVPLVSILLGWKFRKRFSVKYFNLLLLIFFGFGYLFLMHPKATPIWQMLNFLEWLQFPWRFLAPAGFLFSLATGSIALWKPKLKKEILLIIVVPLVFLNLNYFRPEKWLEITDKDHFSNWTKLQTISIFDYLPIKAEHPPTTPAPDDPWFVVGSGKILNYKKGTDWQKGVVEVEKEGKLRLPLFDFPGMQVFLDNKIVSFNSDNELGLITVGIKRGKHSVFVRLTNTPVRKIGNLISVFSFFVLIGALYKLKLNSKLTK